MPVIFILSFKNKRKSRVIREKHAAFETQIGGSKRCDVSLQSVVRYPHLHLDSRVKSKEILLNNLTFP